MLLVQLAESWPPYKRYLERDDALELIENWREYSEQELSRDGGNLAYFHAKLKAHAEYYGLEYEVPGAYEYAAEVMRKKVKREKMPGFVRLFLNIFKPLPTW